MLPPAPPARTSCRSCPVHRGAARHSSSSLTHHAAQLDHRRLWRSNIQQHWRVSGACREWEIVRDVTKPPKHIWIKLGMHRKLICSLDRRHLLSTEHPVTLSPSWEAIQWRRISGNLLPRWNYLLASGRELPAERLEILYRAGQRLECSIPPFRLETVASFTFPTLGICFQLIVGSSGTIRQNVDGSYARSSKATRWPAHPCTTWEPTTPATWEAAARRGAIRMALTPRHALGYLHRSVARASCSPSTTTISPRPRTASSHPPANICWSSRRARPTLASPCLRRHRRHLRKPHLAAVTVAAPTSAGSYADSNPPSPRPRHRRRCRQRT